MDIYKKGVSKLINDIMGNNNSAVMLFAASGCGKTDFLTELSFRYQKVYWFNALIDNVEAFGECLAEKIFGNDPDTLFKVKQLQYNDASIEQEKLLIMTILSHIASLKCNCLLVLERMEALPEMFDKSLIERLIKYSPKNLKIIVSSDVFINFDYTKFEPVYPVLIDEKTLDNGGVRPTFEEYTRELSAEQLSFLKYLSPLNYIDKSFVESIYPEGVTLLNYLSNKEIYFACRDNKYYRMVMAFRKWIEANANIKLGKEEFYEGSAKSKFADYLLKAGRYYEAFRLLDSLGEVKGMNECCKNVVADKSARIMLYRYCSYYNTTLDGDTQKHKHYGIYVALVNYIHGDYQATLDICNALERAFYLDKNESESLSACQSLHLKSLIAMQRPEDAFAYIREITVDGLENNADLYECIFALLPGVCQDNNISADFKLIKSYENRLLNEENKIWYVKLMEAIAFAYFDIGKQEKGMELLFELKKKIPFYTIPSKLIALYYYSGDMQNAEDMICNALNTSKKTEVVDEDCWLYSALGNVNMYYGKTEDALRYFDLSVNNATERNAMYFYNMCIRCMAYAKAGKASYAKEVASIYLKYCETYAPNYMNRIMCALAFCYDRAGNRQEANFYATKAVKLSHSRSIYWVWSMGIAVSFLLERGDLKNAENLIGNLLNTCEKYNMAIPIIETIDVFEPILSFAEKNKLSEEFVKSVREIEEKKNNEKHVSHHLRIKFFGPTAVYSGDEEIQWKTKKAKELFLHYVLAGKEGIDRNIIIDYLWKDYVYESAINNLKTTNNIIRKTLSSYNVKYDLQYINCKYVLEIDDIENDYADFIEILAEYKKEDDIQTRINLMNRLLEKYRDGFAIEMTCQDFLRTRGVLNQELAANMLKLVQDLKSKQMFIDAKKLLSSLIQIEKKDDYKKMMEEIVLNIV